MITQEFLSQCSDKQINRGVAWAKISKFKLIGVCNAQSEIEFNASQNLVKDLNCGLFNPCEYPNDIMPIAFANNISLQADHIGNGAWFADDAMDITVGNTNPLRAICEVYILMSVNK